MRPQLISVVLSCAIVASLAGVRSANAQVSPDDPKQALPAPPPPPTPVAPVAPVAPGTPTGSYVVLDVSLRAVVDRPIAIRLQHGPATAGRLLAFDAETVTVAAANGEVFSVPRSEITGIRLLAPIAPEPPSAAETPPSDATPPAPQTRTVGIHLSITPGIAVDIDHGLFHGFANATLVFPIATDGEWLGFSLGAGVGIPIVARAPALKLDVFGHVNLMAEQSYNYYDPVNPSTSSTDITFAFGVGVGLHYTMQNGFSLGFAAPILGYGVRSNSNGSSSGEGASRYYLSSAIGMPLLFLGYRF